MCAFLGLSVVLMYAPKASNVELGALEMFMVIISLCSTAFPLCVKMHGELHSVEMQV